MMLPQHAAPDLRGIAFSAFEKDPCFPFEEMSSHSRAHQRSARLTTYSLWAAIYVQANAMGSAFADLRK